MKYSHTPISISIRYFVVAFLLILAIPLAGFEAKAAPTPSIPPIVETVLMPLLLDSHNHSDTPASDGSLFQINQLEYLGAFRLDSGRFGGDNTTYTVNYAVGTLAYNPKNHSLFVVGHAQASLVAEFPIPTPGKQTLVSLLPKSDPPLQNFTSLLPESNDQGINRITGMLYYNNALIVNAEQWYNADGDNTDTTLVVANADNLDGTVDGFFRMNGQANSAGYMGEIPLGLQAAFGGAKYFTGWSSVYSIVSRYSYGPSLWTFNPDDLLNGQASDEPNIDATAYMNFAYSSDLRAELDAYDPESAASPLWNILTDGYFGFFIPGSKTFAVFGSSGGVESGIGYKITQTNGNLCGGYCSYDPDDNYNYYWLYDVDTILDAENVSEPRPYAFGKLSLPFDDGGEHRIIGASVDNINNTLYIALEAAGQVGDFDRPPLILTYGWEQ